MSKKHEFDIPILESGSKDSRSDRLSERQVFEAILNFVRHNDVFADAINAFGILPFKLSPDAVYDLPLGGVPQLIRQLAKKNAPLKEEPTSLKESAKSVRQSRSTHDRPQRENKVFEEHLSNSGIISFAIDPVEPRDVNRADQKDQNSEEQGQAISGVVPGRYPEKIEMTKCVFWRLDKDLLMPVLLHLFHEKSIPDGLGLGVHVEYLAPILIGDLPEGVLDPDDDIIPQA